VSQEPGDLSVENEDCDDEGNISVECRITQCCAECGTDLKDATITMEFSTTDEGHEDFEYGHENESVDDDMEDALAATYLLFLLLTEKSEEEIVEALTELRDGFKQEHTYEVETNLDNADYSKGKGRGLQTFRGVEGDITVKCSCGWEHTIEVKVEDNGVAASSMDECC